MTARYILARYFILLTIHIALMPSIIKGDTTTLPESNGATTSMPNYCASKPCQNGGTCIDLVHGYHCACIHGTTGINCETRVDLCLDVPTCGATISTQCCPRSEVRQCVNVYVGYYCDCPPGFFRNVTNYKEQCAISPVSFWVKFSIHSLYPNSLVNSTSEQYKTWSAAVNSTLVENIASIYSARVKSFGTDATKTQIVTLALMSGTPETDVTAVEKITTTFFSSCSSSKTNCFNGQNATLTYVNVTDSCAYICPGDTKCHSNLTGANELTCNCIHGFRNSGTASRLGPIKVDVCEDVDECGENPEVCTHGECVNQVGGHDCICIEGYMLDPNSLTCVPSTACASSPCKHGGTCSAVGKATYVCSCNVLFDGENCESPVPLILMVLCVVFGVASLVISILIVTHRYCWCMDKSDSSSNNDSDQEDVPTLSPYGMPGAFGMQQQPMMMPPMMGYPGQMMHPGFQQPYMGYPPMSPYSSYPMQAAASYDYPSSYHNPGYQGTLLNDTAVFRGASGAARRSRGAGTFASISSRLDGGADDLVYPHRPGPNYDPDNSYLSQTLRHTDGPSLNRRQDAPLAAFEDIPVRQLGRVYDR